jgi:hypothetical protein
MVYLKFKKFSTWHFGHKIGALAVVFLVLGPFLPYWGREHLGGRTDFVAYIDYNTFGLLFLIPLFSALFIFVLLFLNFNIYIDGNKEHKKINHHILMMWGIIFFLIYIADVMRVIYYNTVYSSHFAGFGLWLIVLGFLFCTLSGIIQWRNPQFIGPQFLNGRSRIKKVTVSADSDASAVHKVRVLEDEPSQYPWENSNEAEISLDINNKNSLNNSDKIGKSTTRKRKTGSNEEKTLLRWLEHASGNGRTFEQCLKCNNYGFINTKDTGASIAFECTYCGETFLLEK